MSFSLDVSEFAQKTGRDIEIVKKSAALDIFMGIIIQSPVDTGRFRNNWNVSLNKPNFSTTESVDKSGSKAISGVKATIQASKMSESLHLSNGLPYAQRLEYGWSKQAPSGMVRVNVARFQSYINKAIKSLPK